MSARARVVSSYLGRRAADASSALALGSPRSRARSTRSLTGASAADMAPRASLRLERLKSVDGLDAFLSHHSRRSL
jgi:hypothetical protein